MADRRIIYQAKNLTTGLEGIYAKVLDPLGRDFGTFYLQELKDEFTGIYFFVFPEMDNMKIGDYIGMIVSPSEAHKAPFKVTITEKGALVGQTVVSLKEGDLKGSVSSKNLVGLTSESQLFGSIADSSVKGIVEPTGLVATIKKEELKWTIN